MLRIITAKLRSLGIGAPRSESPNSPSTSSPSISAISNGAAPVLRRSRRAEVLRHNRFSLSRVGLISMPTSSETSASIPETLTAMVRSALVAEIGAMGSGSRMPPSARIRPSRRWGAMTPGMAMDALMASSSGPRCNHTDLPAMRSVVTAV